MGLDLSFQGCFSQRLPLLFWPLCRPKTPTTVQTDGFGMKVMGDVDIAISSPWNSWARRMPASFVQVTVVGLSRFPILQLTTGSRRSFLISTPLTNKKRPVFHGVTSSGWEQSLRIATTTTSTETGGGLMLMPASNGLTGETTTPTISTDRTA